MLIIIIYFTLCFQPQSYRPWQDGPRLLNIHSVLTPWDGTNLSIRDVGTQETQVGHRNEERNRQVVVHFLVDPTPNRDPASRPHMIGR